MRRAHWVALVAAATVAGCGGNGSSEQDRDTLAASDQVGAEADSATSLPPVDFVIIATEEGCTVVGQDELPPGSYSFLLIDDSELGGFKLGVRQFVDGHTFQDVMDAQPVPGQLFARPDFVKPVLGDWKLADSLDNDLNDNETVEAYKLNPGPHGIHIWRLESLAHPPALWGCAPLDVVTDT